MSAYGHILIQLIVGFIGLWIVTRILGKKEIKALTPFDFISAIILGDLVGETVYEKKHSIGMLVFALALWTLLSWLFDKITLRLKCSRKPLEGEAVVLINNGEIDVGKMKESNLDFEYLRMMLRAKDIFSLGKVAYAVYEKNGSLSILQKSQNEGERLILPESLYEDGKYNDKALERIGKNEEWLQQQFINRGSKLERIAYAELNEEGQLSIINKIL